MEIVLCFKENYTFDSEIKNVARKMVQSSTFAPQWSLRTMEETLSQKQLSQWTYYNRVTWCPPDLCR